ncbi:molybdenum ABC transporter ATP-binding protein [Thiothrix winogradskyi]|uniref:Molybdenum ABC transporter ATP-binding protein n=1 Tax=Thiothrix winogradskyi TaxID=96472 RepID=A0ABY3T583_9GAMM|nr:molybdenum ABC transporter ATP-binding protein [Thiothrix winogradskyi]UJS26369.1 molybdenum ABC transporter ATP-binding protein [Thiothrix winogradskyi]
MIEARFHLQFADFTLATDLHLPGSGVTALFGHSGSGKTTLLRCIAGLQRPDNGFLQVRGQVWQDSANGVFLPTHQRPLGYVFQEASLFPHLTARKNMDYGRKRAAQSTNDDELAAIVDMLGIEHLLDKIPAQLSGGERQRVGIARALALKPQVLLMDEPLAALDLKRKQEILPFLERLHRELDIPILYVTHSPQEVTRLADHLVVLEAGKVLASGALAETLTRLDSPLAEGKQASSVLEVRVCGHEPEFHLSQVQFAGGILHIPYQQAAAVDTPLRVRVYARDVSLTLRQPEHSSILNVLPAQVTGLAHGQAGQTVVRLNLGGAPLLAHITRKSAVQLGLQVGMAVFVQIKGTAIV